MILRPLLALWVAAFAVVLALQRPQTGGAGRRYYWPVALDSLAAGRVAHTHVQVTGRVTLVRHEDDGDLHIKLVSRTGFVVCECIPRLPCSRVPTVGERVTVRGVSRHDLEHGWWEVHPVEWIGP